MEHASDYHYNFTVTEEVIRANTASQIYTTILTATQQAQVEAGPSPNPIGWPPLAKRNHSFIASARP